MSKFIWKEYPHVGRDIVVITQDKRIYLGYLSEYDDRTRNIIIQDTKTLERQDKASAKWNRPLQVDVALPVDEIVDLISFSKKAKENIDINPMPLFFIFGWIW